MDSTVYHHTRQTIRVQSKSVVAAAAVARLLIGADLENNRQSLDHTR